MTPAILEHANITVTDPEKTARLLCTLFDWKIRWQGKAIHGGQTIHVGEKNSYLAVYRGPGDLPDQPASYFVRGGLNHVAVIVDDLEETEQRVRAAGLTPTNHADYEPGRRFYFHDHDRIEYEVVCYE